MTVIKSLIPGVNSEQETHDRHSEYGVSYRLKERMPDVSLLGTGVTQTSQKDSWEQLYAAGDGRMFDPHSIPSGEVLNDCYEVISHLGQGGMGTVYLVYHRYLQRECALKILSVDETDEGTATMRFRNEIRALSRLHNEGLVRLFDAGEIKGHLCYTMEYLAGGTLRQQLAREGRLSPKQALLHLRDIAEAVNHIHKADLVHRDLKSENIGFDILGKPVVMDFGLVLRSGLPPEERLTKKNHIVGSVHCMAPEQARAPHTVDYRVDIYAIGILLFEMLTGLPPFAEYQGAEVLVKTMMGQRPSLQSQRPELSTSICHLCEKAMATQPEQRHTNINELIHELNQCLQELA